MTQYGVLINGQLIVHKTKKDGDKAIVYTDSPKTANDEIATFSYEEKDNEIVQIWYVEKSPYEPMEPADIPNEEAFDIIFGGAE